MAILGLGTDIVEIARIEAVIARAAIVSPGGFSATTSGRYGHSTSSRFVFWRSVLR